MRGWRLHLQNYSIGVPPLYTEAPEMQSATAQDASTVVRTGRYMACALGLGGSTAGAPSLAANTARAPPLPDAAGCSEAPVPAQSVRLKHTAFW